ncbi:hypothetical protein KR074_006043 [Drosophila pseudoananassae]|nr:hypothetical protein KR074_006043 [Drosophila pseudoananassae]
MDITRKRSEHRRLRHTPRIDAEYITSLRKKWSAYILNLSKTPTELKLANERANHDLQMSRSNQEETNTKRNQKKELENLIVTPKSVRPLTALYSSPRTTSRMKKALQQMSASKSQSRGEFHFHLCPQCGFVKCQLTKEEHAEQMRRRLKKLLLQFPSLIPKNFKLGKNWNGSI